jgi:integrase
MVKKSERKEGYVRKGKSVLVEPIRNVEDVERIKALLKGRPRDLLLFVMGINNGLRIGDLLGLRVGQVRHLKAGDFVTITEGKTGKQNVLAVNKPVHRALKGYLNNAKLADYDYLFCSTKATTTRKPISVQRAHMLVKDWTRKAGLKGNYGTHTLRKTFGYIQRTQFGVGFEVLAKRFNHSSPAFTMRYVGVGDAEVSDILMHEI